MLFTKPACDYLIVGLGNPGREYERTRHNVGFRALDCLADMLSVRVERAKFSAFLGQGSWNGKKLVLMKPQTYMNSSGEAVAQAVRFYKLQPEQVLVLFDDISLPPGRLRVRGDGSAGGHNGIKSLIACLGSQAFPRIKIGVGAKPVPEYDLADWVLSAFSASEEKLLAPAIERAAQAALTLMDQGLQTAENRFNGPPG